MMPNKHKERHRIESQKELEGRNLVKKQKDSGDPAEDLC